MKLVNNIFTNLYIWVAIFLSSITLSIAQAPFVTTWVTNNPGSSGDTEITIPTNSDFSYSYEVDWNYDGVTFTADDTGVTGDITHEYGVEDTFTVAIKGQFPAIQFDNGGDRQKIINIGAWGEIAWESFNSSFTGCSNLNSDATDSPDLTGVTEMPSCFRGCTAFNGAIRDWDVSNVTNMSSMFTGASAFNQPIGDWDVNNVTNMNFMFANAAAFNQAIGDWDVNNVTNMNFMFAGASAFNQLIGDWDVSNVTTMRSMFNSANAFNQPTGDWDVSNVTDMAFMFNSARVFNQPIGDWDVSNVTTMRQMFDRASVFNQPLGDWDVSKVTNMATMFANAAAFNQAIGDWDVSNVTDMASMFRSAAAFNQDIGGWNVSNVTNMSSMFSIAIAFNQDIGGWDVGSVTNMSIMFRDAAAFNHSIGDWDISNVTTMSSMLDDTGLSIDSLDATLIGWSQQMVQSDVSLGLDNLEYCEAEAAITTLTDPDGSNWTISGGTMMCPAPQAPFVTTWVTNNPGPSTDTQITITTNSSFTYNYEVDWNYDGVTFTADDTGVTGDVTHDYGEIDTVVVAIRGTFPAIQFVNRGFGLEPNGDHQKIININAWGEIAWESFRGAFQGCFNLNSDATDSPDLTGVTDMTICFASCTVFNGAIGDWDVSNVTNMERMFDQASAFNQPIGEWDVSNVTDMPSMFNGAIEFNQPIGDWDVSNVTDMPSMFLEATAFNQPIGDWDVSNVTSMSGMFIGASAFNQPIGDWDVSGVNIMSSMFSRASAFNQPIGEWDVSNVTNMAFMLDSTAISIEQLDTILIKWSALEVEDNISLGAAGLSYCNGADALSSLMMDHNWTLTGATEECPEFDLALTILTSVSGVTLGDKVTYTINVANQGIVDARNIVITDYIPAGLTFLAADNTGLGWTGADGTTDGVVTNSNITDLDVGQATSISLILTVTDLVANLTNAAEISSAQNDSGANPTDADSNFDGINDDMVVDQTGANDHITVDDAPGDEDDHDIATVTAAQFDLALTVLTTAMQVTLGDKVSYTINVGNQGIVDAQNIVITDYIPAGLTFLAADNTGLGWTGADGTTDGIITNANVTNLDIGQASSISLTLTVTDLVANLTNAAEISSAQNDNGLNPPDADSNFDGINDDMVVDQTGANDHVTIDNAPGDEDDHDIAIVTAQEFEIVITQSGDTTITTEGGTTDVVMVSLSQMPSSDVVINVTIDDSTEGEISLGSATASVNPVNTPTLKSNTSTGLELAFSTSTWDIMRPIIITGVDDEIVDGDISYNLTATVDDASSDDDFDGLSEQVPITNQDDGEPCLTNTPVISSVDVINSILCGSFATGQITINIAGSTDNIEYSIDNGATWTSDNTFTDLDGGTYAVLVRYNDGTTICTIDEAVMTELICVIDLSTDASRIALTDALISGPSHICPGESGTYQFEDSVAMCATLIDIDPVTMDTTERDSCFRSAVVPDAQSYIWFSSEEDVTTVETATDLSPLLTIDHSGVADSTDLVLFITDSSGDVYSINQTVHLLTQQECSLYQCLQSAHVSREDMINNNVPTLVTMQEEITSDGLVQFRTTFDFRAGDNIELQAGFEVESGGTFVAIIEGCDVNDPTTKD